MIHFSDLDRLDAQGSLTPKFFFFPMAFYRAGQYSERLEDENTVYIFPIPYDIGDHDDIGDHHNEHRARHEHQLCLHCFDPLYYPYLQAFVGRPQDLGIPIVTCLSTQRAAL